MYVPGILRLLLCFVYSSTQYLMHYVPGIVLLILISTMKLGGRNYYSCFTDDGTALGEQMEPDYRIRIINILGK